METEFKSMADVYNYFACKQVSNEFINEIYDGIINNKICKFLIEDHKEFRMKNKDFPELCKSHHELIKRNHYFIVNNRELVFEYLKNGKDKKKIANQKYYAKKCSEKSVRILLTDEEKKERRKEANKRYYEKRKNAV